jgi:hypothetical protein
MADNDFDSIKWKKLIAESDSSSTPEVEELALRIALRRAQMDWSGSSSFGASTMGRVGS